MDSRAYHEATKHYFGRFAPALGYLDWAAQPDPFRRFAGSALIDLPREPLAPDVVYDALYDGTAPSRPIDLHSIGEFLRCSMGLSAWKQYGASRWPLRVNPSSGNLHPTETYVVWDGRVCHYAVKEHALEERSFASREGSRLIKPGSESDAALTLSDAARTFTVRETSFLVGLTSIHWREAWKYGERAFRYCQHDAGHAIGALRLSAAMLGWRLLLLPRWSDADIAAVLGVDRDEDFEGAEREDPECLAIVTADDPALFNADPAPWLEAARSAQWQGRANRLSRDHVDWPLIDKVARATVRDAMVRGATVRGATVRGATVQRLQPVAPQSARTIILQRRSALAFDPNAAPLPRDAFMSMLDRLQPGASPWDAIDWPPHVHLALFVHRVEGLVPGLYAYLREPAVLPEWKAAMRPEFLWEPINDPNVPNEPNEPNDLFLLVPIDCRRMANRVSCDQDIAAAGFFSLGMIARFGAPLREQGDWMYRRLFWESGLIGQVLYLEAEAAGARATGIGCFYDDPMHELLGLSGHDWQSLYHFSMGMPVEDTRLTTEPGYAWE